jgi:ferredoxin
VNPVARATENLHLIRPPGSRSNEREFLSLCARCGMCVQVCRTNTLQPATLLSGLETAMTPVLTPEIAGCDPCCTACGQVCPTNAIAPFSAESKLRVKLGTAKIERDRCIGWTEGTECNECAVICPTLAIKAARIAGVIRPVRVSFAECTGCGMCVQRCNQIVANSAACVVSAKGRGLATDIAAVSKQRQERAAISPRHFPVIDIPPGELS